MNITHGQLSCLIFGRLMKAELPFLRNIHIEHAVPAGSHVEDGFTPCWDHPQQHRSLV